MSRSAEPSGALRLEDVQVGDVLPPRTVHVDRARLVQYAGASLDRNPIHWDEHSARAVGLPDVIAHGMFTFGAAVEIVSDWVGDPGRILECGTKFVGQVVVPRDGGADVEVSAVVKSVDPDLRRATVEVTATCGGGKVLGRTPVVVALA